MHGTIVINAVAGQALRKQPGALLLADVLGCAGDFRAGDDVYVVVRGSDGGQGVFAAGRVGCDAMRLPRIRMASTDGPNAAIEGDGAAVVIAANDFRLLWPAGNQAAG
jgi:glutamate 5-kinase